MASYDYRCRSCELVFTVRRSMSEPASAVRCPAGHDDVSRVWAAVAVTGRAPSAPTPRAGGCCGGACGCR
ncbi:MAG: FmdB family zinc ribbon protein [Mycobacteriales bacterium]